MDVVSHRPAVLNGRARSSGLEFELTLSHPHLSAALADDSHDLRVRDRRLDLDSGLVDLLSSEITERTSVRRPRLQDARRTTDLELSRVLQLRVHLDLERVDLQH